MLCSSCSHYISICVTALNQRFRPSLTIYQGYKIRTPREVVRRFLHLHDAIRSHQAVLVRVVTSERTKESRIDKCKLAEMTKLLSQEQAYLVREKTGLHL
uniref:Uncharacterized protein n=1 Tax=Arundo donax TaxID=35708 RepID=A0A0A9E9U4_ARUDO